MIDNETNEFLQNLKNNISKFMEEMSQNDFSYFKYSLSGDILDSSKKWGLGNLVFAVKILYITGLLDKIEEKRKYNLFNGIMKFSDKNGYIFDPFITKLTIYQHILNLLGKVELTQIEDIKRAETRQSYAALYLLNKIPEKPFIHIPYTKNTINDYLSSFDWRFPWGAGSHFSHLLFFLTMNSKLFNYKNEESKELISYAVEWISKIQSPRDGCWYTGTNTSLYQKINGAMKVFTGLHVAGIYDIPYTEKLIDTALSGINDADACGNFNIVYVLYGCNKINPDYRKDEINNFLLNRIKLYKDFYYPDKGGFSFLKNQANSVYYGKKISKGKNEPDIHGTILFTWGLSIINQIVDIGLTFNVPLN